MSQRIEFVGADKVTFPGWDFGAENNRGMKILAKKGRFVAVKIKGHFYWSGRGETSYAPAEIRIYQTCKEGKEVLAQEVLAFPVRGKGEVKNLSEFVNALLEG